MGSMRPWQHLSIWCVEQAFRPQLPVGSLATSGVETDQHFRKSRACRSKEST